MGNKLMAVGIAVLAVIAVVLGYLIYQETLGTKTPSVSQTQPPQTPATPQTGGSQQAGQQADQQILPSVEEQELVKAVPLPDAPLEERIEYNKKLEKFEKVTDIVEVNNCWPNPFIARVREDTDLKIKNNDNVENLIFIGQKEIKVAANTTTIVKPGKGDSITNLTCNGGGQGLLHVIQTE